MSKIKNLKIRGLLEKPLEERKPPRVCGGIFYNILFFPEQLLWLEERSVQRNLTEES